MQPYAADFECQDAPHTPPEEWVRAKNFCITFDTNFGRYLPRGTIIDGSQKCRMGAFCTISKYSGEMSKKGLKTGQNAVNLFFSPHTYWKITIVAIFFKPSHFGTFKTLFSGLISTKLFKKRICTALKASILKIKECYKWYFLICVRAEKFLTPFWPVFKPFFNISPEIFAIVQKALIRHFRDPSIIVPLGK